MAACCPLSTRSCRDLVIALADMGWLVRHHAAKARLAADGSAINFVRTPLPILPIGKSGLEVQQPPPAQSVVAVAAVAAVEANPGAAQAAGVGANSMATLSHTGQAARAVRLLPKQDSEVDV
ncbi:hypothetical protein HaLaN_00564 [Haematococcus lacustris]|uniref:Uncharacterized protein n=1 Tax=Haematococcus lacustris TaxID=44745 RepID=A0A699Y749_HAELA|nr:hypothetical protein HaLaN_00564 [Haematococcus lacustris]